MLRFYEVQPHAHPTYFWSEAHPLPKDYVRLLTSKTTPRRRPVFRANTGRFKGDVIASIVWSRRLGNVLSESKATGVATYPVKVMRGRQQLDGYVALRVFGKGGPFDDKRGKATYWKDGSIWSYDGIYMDESQWDGSDVFTIPGLGIGIFIVERVVKELEKIKPTNVSFTLSIECRM
jgi:hypothetical protein